jgi:hypothetical protein
MSQPPVDESLEKWRKELEGDKDDPLANPADDPRRFILEEFSVHIENGPTVVYDFTKDGLEKAANEAYQLKEGDNFHYEMKFKIHHEFMYGVKLICKSKKAIGSNEQEFEIGNFPPKVAQLSKVMTTCEVPKGFFARGKYDVVNTIVDNKGTKLFEFNSKFEIVKG